jgi:hypothetical protein
MPRIIVVGILRAENASQEPTFTLTVEPNVLPACKSMAKIALRSGINPTAHKQGVLPPGMRIKCKFDQRA